MMRTTLATGKLAEKRAKLAIYAIWFFHLLRMFWVTELALPLVVFYGLFAGWSEPVQWSDGFFYAAVAQLLIAAINWVGSPGEVSAASEVRYIFRGNVIETRKQLAQLAERSGLFSLRVFIGCLLTFLIAALFMLG